MQRIHVYSEGVTWCGSRLVQWAWHSCLVENLASKTSSVVFQKQFVFCFANQQKHILYCWQTDGRNPKPFDLFYLFQHLHICFCCCVALMYWIFLKPSRQNCNVFRPKKTNNSLFLFIFERRNVEISCNKILFWKQLSWYIANHGTHQWWQLLQAAKGTWTQISWSTIIKVKTPFNLWEFSISGETDQEFTFKDVYYSPSIFLSPHPIPSQVSWFPLHIQRSNKTMRKYRAVNSLSRNLLCAYFWQFRAK